MDYVFCNWDEFAYLNESNFTKKGVDEKSSKTSEKKRFQSFKRAVLPLVFMSSIALSSGVLANNFEASTTAPQVIKRKFEKEKLVSRLKKSMKSMRLQKNEAVSLMGVSENTLNSLIDGEVEEPQGDTLKKYSDFLKIYSLLNHVHNGRPFAMRSALTTPMLAFSGKTAVKYAQEDSSLDYVIATLKRIYG